MERAPPRFAHRSDLPALNRLFEACGLFDADDLKLMADLAEGDLGGPGEAQSLWVVAPDGEGVAGATYVVPERMTKGTWNMLFLGVRPNHQRHGVGRALVTFVEAWLAAEGARLVLVETAGISDFAHAREFYRACGYAAEASIRNFYDAGVDKIVFAKAL